MLEQLLATLRRSDRSGTILYHAFYPATRVFHALLADRALLEDPPRQDILGLDRAEGHPELDHMLTSCLEAANDFADKHGEQLRPVQALTGQMKVDFQRAFNKRYGAPRANGRAPSPHTWESGWTAPQHGPSTVGLWLNGRPSNRRPHTEAQP